MSFESLLEKTKDTSAKKEEKSRTSTTGFDSLAAKRRPFSGAQEQANANLTATQGIAPEQEAKDYQTSKDTGYPISTIRLVPQLVKNQSINVTPQRETLKEFFAIDYTTAAISRGDEPNLERAEDVLMGRTPLGPRQGTLEELPERAPGQPTFIERAKEASIRQQESIEKAGIRWRQLTGPISIEDERRLETIQSGLDKPVLKPLVEPHGIVETLQSFVEEAFVGTVGQAPIIAGVTIKGAERSFLGAVTGVTGAVVTGQPELIPPLAVGGGAIGFKFGTAEAIFKLEAGFAADEFMSFRDENGEPLDPGIIWVASMGVGAANATLEAASLAFVLRTIPGASRLFGRVTAGEVATVLKNPTVRRQLLEIGKKFGKAAGFEPLQEMGQEASTIIGGELAKIASKELEGKEFKPITIKEAKERILGAGKETIGPALIFPLPGTLMGIYQTTNNIEISNKFRDKTDTGRRALAETNTAQLSTDHAKQFIKTVGAEADVYVTSEGMKQLFQSHTKEETDALLQKIGVEPDKARKTVATGEDTTVKASDILTLPDEEYNIIKEDVKPAPGAYTQREIKAGEANEDIENLAKVVKEDVEKSAKINAEITRIQGEAEKAGLSKEVAENAPILMQGISNKLELEGVDPVEFLQKISLKKERFADIKALINKGKQIFQAEIKEPGEIVTAKGMLTIEKEAYTISLFENANLSTVLHEVGHIALNEYSNLEIEGVASESLKKDMTTIREWVGAEEGHDFSTEQIEQFARGFEAYLMEGKAPTSSLIPAFERFKNWLRETYKIVKRLTQKDISEALRITLNKDVRQVFDRMLSANIEVEAAAAEGGFIVKTVEEMDALGMVPADKVFATKLMEQVTKIAGRRLTQDRNKGYKQNLSKWKEESREELKRENKVYRIIEAINDAVLFLKATKSKEKIQWSRDEFIERHGKEAIKDLPTSRILIKDGISLDEAAVQYEYDDANKMIEDFFATPKFSVAVNQRVAEKQTAHDSQFLAEDYIVDLKEYRDYLDIMARYIGGKGVGAAQVSAGIQRNLSRWEKAAEQEIKEEQPGLSVEERNREVGLRVQEKIDKFQQGKAKPSVIAQETIKRLARETMAAKTVREARRVDKYLGAMKKASNDERRAILRKDWGEASKQNELARFNYEMAGLSVKIRDEVDTILNRAKKIGKPKKTETVDATHKEAILHLIDRYRLASLVPSDPLTEPDYATLFAGDNTSGNEDGPRTNDGFNETDFLRSRVADFRGLSTEHLRDLDNAIRYLELTGRIAKDDLLSDGIRKSDVVDESTEVMDKVKPKTVWEKGSMMRRLSDVTRKVFANFDSLNFIAKSLDGYTNLGKDGVKGPVERFIIDRIKDADNMRILNAIEIEKAVRPHLVQIDKTIRKWHKKFGNRITIEGAQVPELLQLDGQTKGWKADQIFAVVLNTGNTGETSNLQNLMAGYEDLNAGAIENIKNMLGVKDMRAVQGVWDVIDSLFKKANEQHVKIKGFDMTKIESTPFVFKGESFRGGYYPIAHDRDLSFVVDDRGKKTDLFESDEATFTTPYAKSGHSIKRIKGVALPIRLNLNVVGNHIDNVLRYTYLSDAIRDADKITRDSGFRASAVNILGKDVYSTIRPALKHIANPRREGSGGIVDKAVEWMRGKSTAYILAWNTGVAIKQPLSTAGAIHDMGAKAYLDGFSSVLVSPAAHYQKMIELSPYMRDRLKSFDRELRSAFAKLTPEQKGVYFGDKKVTWDDVANFGFWQIRIADTTTVLPIWHGAFNDKLNAGQSNLDEAIRYADDIVRNSQPSAQPLDLSTWQRDGGAVRLFSSFQTFTVGKYGQRQRLYYRAWRNKSITNAQYAWFNFMDAFVPLIAINLLQSLIWGNDLGDEDTQKDIVVDVLQGWLTMGVPIVSNVARSILRYGDPFDSPVLETANKATRGVVNGVVGLADFEDRKSREKALWGIAHAASILSRVPVSKIAQRAERGAEQQKGVPGIKYLVPAPPSRR